MNALKLAEFVLECREVFKDYVEAGARVKVLTGVSLGVKPGEHIAIIGRSGSGKTTLLQILGGLDFPTSGNTWITGHNLYRISERKLEHIRNQSLGFIYQMHHLLPEFTAIENVAMPLLIAGISPTIAQRLAMESLEQVGLQARLRHRPAELSGGERQRVAIARALVHDPECILADEPTGNLDEESAEQVFELLQNLNRTKKTSLVMVTHDMQLAARMDRTYILHGGILSAQ